MHVIPTALVTAALLLSGTATAEAHRPSQHQPPALAITHVKVHCDSVSWRVKFVDDNAGTTLTVVGGPSVGSFSSHVSPLVAKVVVKPGMEVAILAQSFVDSEQVAATLMSRTYVIPTCRERRHHDRGDN